MIKNLWPTWVIFFMFSFVTSSRLNIFCNVLLYCYCLLHLTSSFSLNRSLLIPYAYVSIKWTDWFILSLFELKAILTIFSIKTLCFSLLNLCCAFNINWFNFVNSLSSFLRLSLPILLILDDSFFFQVELLLNSFHHFPI